MSRGFSSKLTAAQRMKMFEMRKQGMTYKEIACYFPVTESRVGQILSKWPSRIEQRRIDRYVFPNIAKWLNDTGMSFFRLAELTDYSESSISNYLRGRCQPSLAFIKAFLRVSGMTFEEAFMEAHETKSAAPSDAEQKG